MVVKRSAELNLQAAGLLAVAVDDMRYRKSHILRHMACTIRHPGCLQLPWKERKRLLNIRFTAVLQQGEQMINVTDMTPGLSCPGISPGGFTEGT